MTVRETVNRFPVSGFQAAERAHQMVEHLKSSAAEIFRGSDGNEAQGPAPLFNSEALQAWILTNCQVAHGGMRDKPNKQPDYYHTCYCLSGLSAAQHCPGAALVGPPSNKLARTDPLINVRSDKLERAREFFAALEPAA